MKRLLIILFFCVLFITAYGQISTGEMPFSFRSNIVSLKRAPADLRIMPSLDMDRINLEDLQDEEDGVPPRFGFLHKVYFDLDNSGTWTTLDNGDKIWQLGIYCPNALSINLLYEKFWIPEKAKFYVYSEDKKHVLGAFTSVNNKGEKDNIQGFATGLVYGDKITLEYYLPAEIKDQGAISIAYVVHGYRYINLPGDETKSFGGSGDCQVNVNCSEGQSWQNEKDAVALILVNGNRYCTGSLINTTANDNRPLFLTADHCLGGWANNYIKYDAITNPTLNHWSFYWHYESPTCLTSYEPAIRSTTGATVVANNDISDFALLRLTEDPRNRTGVTPYYLGWDRSGNSGTGGVGIHHPVGDVKKIATLNDTTSSSWKGNVNFWSHYWNQTTHGHSVTEGGSSGSPLINNSRHVIGQLYGGSSINCANPSQDIAAYGKFSVSWTGDGATDSRRRLSDWLDPCGIDVITMSGLHSLYITGPTLVCSSGAEFTLNNLPDVDSIIWIPGPDLEITSDQGTSSCTMSATGSDSSWVQARLVNDCGSIILPRYNLWAGLPDYPMVDPSSSPIYQPINNTFRVTISESPGASKETGFWETYGNVTLNGSNSGSSASFYSSPIDGIGTIYVSTTNACGGNYYKTAITVITGTGGDGGELPESIQQPSLVISPNPARSYINVEIRPIPDNSDFKAQIKILNSDSMIVSQVMADNRSIRLNVSGLVTGTYVVIVETGNMRLHGKFMVLK